MTQNTEQNVRRFRHLKRGTEYRLIGRGKLQQNGPFDMAEVVIYQDVNDGSLWARSPSEFYDGRFEEILEAEARGAEEQRQKDAEGSLRPMPEAKKDRSVILAKIHDDLFPSIRPNRSDLKPWNGRWVVVNHPGILEDGFDLGWSVAAPVGHGGFPDDWFVGWKPLDQPANVAALEAEIASLKEAEQLARVDAEASKARVKVLEVENNTLKTRVINAAENLLSIETPCMEGDNFAVTICSYFEDCEGETCDSGWHEGATKAYEEIKDAVLQHFRAALTREGGV